MNFKEGSAKFRNHPRLLTFTQRSTESRYQKFLLTFIELNLQWIFFHLLWSVFVLANYFYFQNETKKNKSKLLISSFWINAIDLVHTILSFVVLYYSLVSQKSPQMRSSLKNSKFVQFTILNFLLNFTIMARFGNEYWSILFNLLNYVSLTIDGYQEGLASLMGMILNNIFTFLSSGSTASLEKNIIYFASFSVYLLNFSHQRDFEFYLRKLWSRLEVIKSSESLSTTQLEALHNPYIVFDKNTRIVRNNKAAFELYKLSLVDEDAYFDMKNVSSIEIFEPESGKALIDKIAELNDEKSSDELVLRVKKSLVNGPDDPKEPIVSLYKIHITMKAILNENLYFLSFTQLSDLLKIESQTNELIKLHIPPLQEIIETIEKDYTKWNNLQILEVIKESDLKNLASCVTGLIMLKNSLYIEGININRVNNPVKSKNFYESEEEEEFYIRNVILQSCEVLSTNILENGTEIQLKFEDSFPQQSVFGRLEAFRQALVICNRIILHLTFEKLKLINIDCKLEKYSKNGTFHLLIQFEMQRKNENTLSAIFTLKLFEDKTSKIYDLFQTLKKVLLLGEGEVELAPNPNYNAVLKLHLPFRTTQMISPSNKKLIKPQILSLSFCREQSKTNENLYTWRPKPKNQMKNPVVKKKETEQKASSLISERIPSAKMIMTKPSPGFNSNIPKNNVEKSNYMTSEEETTADHHTRKKAESITSIKVKKPNLKLKVDVDDNDPKQKKLPPKTCEEKSIFARKKNRLTAKSDKNSAKPVFTHERHRNILMDDIISGSEIFTNSPIVSSIKDTGRSNLLSPSLNHIDLTDLKNSINRLRPKFERHVLELVRNLLNFYPDVNIANPESASIKIETTPNEHDSDDPFFTEEPPNFRKQFKRKQRPRRMTLNMDIKRFSFTPRLVNYLKDRFEWTDGLKSEQLQNDFHSHKYSKLNEVEENQEKLFILARNYRHKRMWIPQKNFSVYPHLDFSTANREPHIISILLVVMDEDIKNKLESIPFTDHIKILNVNNIFEAFDMYRCYVEMGFIYRAIIVDLEETSFHGMILFEMVRNFERRFLVKDTFILGIMPSKIGCEVRDTIVHNVRTSMSIIRKPLDETKLASIREYIVSI